MMEPTDLKPEIHAALAQRGFQAVRAQLLSPLGEKKGRRCAYRVENSAGQILKVRLFENEEEAESVYRLRTPLDDAFAPVLECHKSVLIEAWVDGVPLAERDQQAWIEPAGALLARLHAQPLPPDEPRTVSTRRWLDAAESDLGILTAAGQIRTSEADRLRRGLLQSDPRECPVAVIHTDFCADNMLIDTAGRLRVIDNEGIALRPAGFDLGRTFQLWPMSLEMRERFHRGYLSALPLPNGLGFWRTVAVLMNSRIFFKFNPARLEASIALLRSLLEDEAVSDAS